MKSSPPSHSFITNTFLFLLSISLLLQGAYAAFTAPVERNGDYIDQNADGQWCFYPDALNPATIDVACLGPEKGDYARVLSAHLNSTSSINYFSPSLEILGTSSWPVDTASQARKIYLCATGRAGDYTYQTLCTTVGKDNSLGAGGPSPYCKVAVGQRRVTDGCYIPNQEVPKPEVVGASSRRAAVVTITRTSSGAPAQTSLVRDSPVAATTQPGSASKHTAFGWTAVSSLLVSLALFVHL